MAQKKQKNPKIEDLIASGIIGAALGALISENKSGAVLGAIAGAAVFASVDAFEKASQTDVPVMVKKGNKLYEVRKDGTKKFVKNLPTKPTTIPSTGNIEF